MYEDHSTSRADKRPPTHSPIALKVLPQTSVMDPQPEEMASTAPPQPEEMVSKHSPQSGVPQSPHPLHTSPMESKLQSPHASTTPPKHDPQPSSSGLHASPSESHSGPQPPPRSLRPSQQQTQGFSTPRESQRPSEKKSQAPPQVSPILMQQQSISPKQPQSVGLHGSSRFPKSTPSSKNDGVIWSNFKLSLVAKIATAAAMPPAVATASAGTRYDLFGLGGDVER
mmetsp:Transcript_31223/g.42296  ORF Transcript_31223/g.42296 Transcript_31223/m.42296 type:complete len:226 (+) Transcript_31223:44-721(+)